MIRFSEMPYERPDVEGLKAAVEEATRKVREAKSAAEVRDAYFALQEKEEASDTAVQPGVCAEYDRHERRLL